MDSQYGNLLSHVYAHYRDPYFDFMHLLTNSTSNVYVRVGLPFLCINNIMILQAYSTHEVKIGISVVCICMG